MITGQGRDHVVNVQSGRKNLVIGYVHFEPELTLCSRERLRLITPHWPSYPDTVSIIILDDFNICGCKGIHLHYRKWLRKNYRKWLRKQHEVQHEQ